ncbi:MAG: hypothetical protein LBO05_01940 [Deltaproteobacteria bacterium]|jgi:hypothetical protein|nr:hypothetical protein [Deltaproteobacteria bacterium]
MKGKERREAARKKEAAREKAGNHQQSGIRTKKAEEKERSTSAGGTVKRQVPPASL